MRVPPCETAIAVPAHCASCAKSLASDGSVDVLDRHSWVNGHRERPRGWRRQPFAQKPAKAAASSGVELSTRMRR